MQYRKMPKTGDALSILGFGCMRLPIKDGRIDEPRAIAQIHHAIDNGVNYVDTAWPYHGGQSEPLLAKALRNGYREKVRLATKLPSWMIQSRADMDRYLAAQMERLDASRIDYYLLHTLSGSTWEHLKDLGVGDFLDQALTDGRIGNAGFSFHGLAPDFKPIVDAYPWTFCQIQFNYLDLEYQAGLEGLKYAAAKGLGVIVMEPLRGGNLARPTPPATVEKIWNEANIKRTPVEWALRWIWNHPEVTLLLSGMNEEAHIEENLAIADTARAGEMSEGELALVERAGRTYRKLMKVGCTGCGYCMPCPANVLIPGCLEEYNQLHMFGPADVVKFRYAFKMSGLLGGGNTGFASQCVQCGACLEKCPQGIPIPDVLSQVAAEMEGPDLPDRIAFARKMFRTDA